MKKIVLVTGASSGIGHYIALKLNETGYNVIAIDKAHAEFPNSISFHLINLCDENSVMQLFEKISHLDFAINCAGVSAIRKQLTEFTASELSAEWQENFLANFNPLKAEILLMRKQMHGNIINISSIAAIRGMENFTAYGTAKASIRILTKIAAIENAKFNIRVNSISPATIDTPMIRKKFNGELRDYSSTYYTGNCGTTNDIYSCIKMFMENNFLTGHDLCIDGGLSDLCRI